MAETFTVTCFPVHAGRSKPIGDGGEGDASWVAECACGWASYAGSREECVDRFWIHVGAYRPPPRLEPVWRPSDGGDGLLFDPTKNYAR